MDVDADYLEQLIAKNDAIFLRTGAQKPRATALDDRELNGVIDGLSYLSDVGHDLAEAPDLTGKQVVILGGGDTAIDCARSAIRHGAAGVTLAYRRAHEDMRAPLKDIETAREEGVAFTFNKHPQAFLGEGRLEAILFNDGIGGHGIPHACDIALIAFGQEAHDTDWLERLGIRCDQEGFVIAYENGQTSNPKVYVGGDNSHGPDLVVAAVMAGRRAGLGMRDHTDNGSRLNR